MRKYPGVGLLSVWLVLCFSLIEVQCQIISNGSFEGTPVTGVPPEGWSACHYYSTPDTQPGSWGVTQSASNGSTYISLVTRGSETETPNTTENVQTQLLKTMLKGNEYHLDIDLAYSEVFQWGIYSYTNPAKLQVFGGVNSCDKKELLWESQPINHTEWKTYNVNLMPTITNVDYLIFEAQFLAGSTSGNILLDNLNIDFCGFAAPIVTEPFDQSVCRGIFVILDATTPEATFLWSDGTTASTLKVAEEGLYRVEVSNGCESKFFEYNIQMRDCVCEASLPNVFTPNGDGFNDTMEVSTESTVSIFSLMIFDRAGGEIFKSEDIYNAWTGEKNGTEMPTGTYFWTVAMTCFQGNQKQENNYRGWVQLIR